MNPEELMINDLIYVYGQNGNLSSKPHWYVRRVTADWLVDMVKTNGINDFCVKNNISIPEGMTFIGDTKPIPLTDKILRANFGNKQRGSCGEGYYFCTKDGVENCIVNGVLTIGKVSSDDYILVLLVANVDELQRALRCCGFNKLANNFKID